MQRILEQVYRFAETAHNSQRRKYSGRKYIEHPQRVMELCKDYTRDVSVLAAALLHDVLEDTPVRAGEIRAFLLKIMDKKEAMKTMELVRDLTDVYVKKDYPQWNRKKRKSLEAERLKVSHPDAQTIKYADIIDNCRDIVKYDRDFAKVFLRECAALLRIMNKGNSALYKLAIETVNVGLNELRADSDPVRQEEFPDQGIL